MRFLPPQPPTPTLSLFPEAPSPAPTASPTSAHGHSSPFSRPCCVCRGAADPPRPLGEVSLTFAYCLHRFGPRNLKESLTSVDSCTGDAPGAGPHWGGAVPTSTGTRGAAGPGLTPASHPGPAAPWGEGRGGHSRGSGRDPSLGKAPELPALVTHAPSFILPGRALSVAASEKPFHFIIV